MPFALIPTALGVCFFLVWAFIGVMILRDGHRVAIGEGERYDQPWPAAKRSRRQAA
jgi:hypothetical protein